MTLLIFASSSARAGVLTLGAKASIYNPPEEGASPTLMYGFVLDYDINAHLHARAGASYTSYSAKGVRYTLMPITFNLIYHLMPGNFIDPYLGGGVGYYSKTEDGNEYGRTGGQAVAGMRFSVGGLNAAIEATYIDPNFDDLESGTMSWGGWAAGTTYVFIPF